MLGTLPKLRTIYPTISCVSSFSKLNVQFVLFCYPT